MSVLKVTYYPDDPLTQKAEPVEEFDAKLKELAGNMFDTMRAYEGVGLAAPQVGVSIRLFVLQEPDGEGLCLINPELSEAEGSEEGEEGCLSMPTLYAMVSRATKIRVRAFDLDGEALDFEARDFLARIIQHENDHLDGILFPERLDIISRQGILETWTEVRKQLEASEREAETEHAS